MALHKLEFKPSAERELRNLSKYLITRIGKAIESLAANPFPRQSAKLLGSENAYRLRVGEYRVVYTVDNDASCITIFRVRHRKNVYRKF